MAAKMLAEHGEVEAAIRRLMRPVDEAAKQGLRPSPWADEATLNQLYTYCTSLTSDAASLLVSCGFTAAHICLCLRLNWLVICFLPVWVCCSLGHDIL
jgi:hypothetical protein